MLIFCYIAKLSPSFSSAGLSLALMLFSPTHHIASATKQPTREGLFLSKLEAKPNKTGKPS